jgi:hypothetical protein
MDHFYIKDHAYHLAQILLIKIILLTCVLIVLNLAKIAMNYQLIVLHASIAHIGTIFNATIFVRLVIMVIHLMESVKSVS